MITSPTAAKAEPRIWRPKGTGRLRRHEGIGTLPSYLCARISPKSRETFTKKLARFPDRLNMLPHCLSRWGGATGCGASLAMAIHANARRFGNCPPASGRRRTNRSPNASPKTSPKRNFDKSNAVTASWWTHWNEGGLHANWQDINWVGLPEWLEGKQASSNCSLPRRFFANGVESAADPGYRSNLGLQTRGRPRY